MSKLPKDHFCYKNPLMRESIDILGLPPRAANSLKNVHILYIGQLMLFNTKNILCVPDMGRYSLADVVKALAFRHLKLGTVPSPIKSEQDFYTLDVEEFYCLDSEFITTVSLPAPAVAGLSDDDIVAAIQGACQSAFNVAVVNRLYAATAEFMAATAMDAKPPKAIVVQSDVAGFPTFDIREVKVPLKCDATLNAVFKKNVLEAVAQSLSGTTLYPVLASVLEGLSAKP